MLLTYWLDTLQGNILKSQLARATRQRRKLNKSRTTPALERLEQRMLLSSVALNSGVLDITLTGDDDVEVTPDGGGGLNVVITGLSTFNHGDATDVTTINVTAGSGANEIDLDAIDDDAGEFDNGGGVTISVTGGDGADKLRASKLGGFYDGEEGNDTLVGSTAADVMYGGEDDDLFFGGSGDDCLYGGAGNDVIKGQGGYDTLVGDEGNDSIVGEEHDDHVEGGDGDDTVDGGDGNDFVNGGLDDDCVLGGDGNDLVFSGSGEDILWGGIGNDTLQGQGYNDTIHGEAGNDSILGGAGNDFLYGEAGDDTILGGDGDDFIRGDGDNDVLMGEDGDDTIEGSLGNDSIVGGLDDDSLNGEDGTDTISGDAGNDMIGGGDDADSLTGGDGLDSITGDAGNDTISGGDGDDSLAGSSGNDSIDGDGGSDSVAGGTGADTVWSGTGADSGSNENVEGEEDVDFVNGDNEGAYLAFDSFTDTNGTDLDAHTMDVGSGWTEYIYDWEITGDQAHGTDLTLNDSGYIITGLGVSDVILRADMTPGAAPNYIATGFVLRFQDTNNFLLVEIVDTDDTLNLWKRQSGSWTKLDTVSYSISSGTTYDFKVIANGEDITAFVDGAQVANFSSNLFTSATKHGMRSVQTTPNPMDPVTTTNKFDNFRARQVTNEAPEFDNETETVNLSEYFQIDTVIATFKATDADGDPIIYSEVGNSLSTNGLDVVTRIDINGDYVADLVCVDPHEFWNAVISDPGLIVGIEASDTFATDTLEISFTYGDEFVGKKSGGSTAVAFSAVSGTAGFPSTLPPAGKVTVIVGYRGVHSFLIILDSTGNMTAYSGGPTEELGGGDLHADSGTYGIYEEHNAKVKFKEVGTISATGVTTKLDDAIDDINDAARDYKTQTNNCHSATTYFIMELGLAPGDSPVPGGVLAPDWGDEPDGV